MTFDVALKIIAGIGIPTIVIALIYIGRKFQILDDLKDGFKNIGDKIERIGKEVSEVDSRVSKIEGKLFGVAIGASPIKLTPLGQEVLQNSGILVILKPKTQFLITKIKEQKPQTAYDVQELTKNIFTIENLELSQEEENKLKNYAFTKGITLNDVLYASAIYFRDVALQELGFKIEDLDL